MARPLGDNPVPDDGVVPSGAPSLTPGRRRPTDAPGDPAGDLLLLVVSVEVPGGWANVSDGRAAHDDTSFVCGHGGDELAGVFAERLSARCRTSTQNAAHTSATAAPERHLKFPPMSDDQVCERSARRRSHRREVDRSGSRRRRWSDRRRPRSRHGDVDGRGSRVEPWMEPMTAGRRPTPSRLTRRAGRLDDEG